MKHRIRDIVLSIIAYTGVAFLYRTWRKRSGPLVRIIVFHDVPDKAWFDALITELTRVAHVLTPEEFYAKQFEENKLNVLITFDDGYATWVTKVLPVLISHNVKAIFFVSSGLLDVAHDTAKSDEYMHSELMIRPRSPLTWDGARTLLLHGHVIGSHGYHHVNLAHTSNEEIESILTIDRKRIEEELGVTPTECAYPFGTKSHVNEHVVSTTERVGYQRGYTALSRFVSPHETFLIPRLCIEDTVTPQSLRVWLFGAYDIFDMVKSFCK